MSEEFAGEVVKDYTQPAPALWFKEKDGDLYKAYQEESLAVSQKYFRLLVDRNGE